MGVCPWNARVETLLSDHKIRKIEMYHCFSTTAFKSKVVNERGVLLNVIWI